MGYMIVERDMRARLFRERNPAAFGILSEPNPPVLAKVPATITQREAVREQGEAARVTGPLPFASTARRGIRRARLD